MSYELDVASVVQAVPSGFQSESLALNHIKYSFVVGIGFFLLMVPFCKSRKSFFDAVAAQKILKLLRTLIFVEIICLLVLLSDYVETGNPIYLHAALDYGNGDSWLYGFGRPVSGLVFIGVGLFGALYPIPRLLCMLGCFAEIVGDAISAFQVRDQYNQVREEGAPSNGYSEYGLQVYYWRDIVSIALCSTIFLSMAWLSCIVGWCDPQLIHPSQVTGHDLDRVSVLHNMRTKRKYMERVGLVEAPILPVFHHHLADFHLKGVVEQGKDGKASAEDGDEEKDRKELSRGQANQGGAGEQDVESAGILIEGGRGSTASE